MPEQSKSSSALSMRSTSPSLSSFSSSGEQYRVFVLFSTDSRMAPCMFSVTEPAESRTISSSSSSSIGVTLIPFLASSAMCSAPNTLLRKDSVDATEEAALLNEPSDDESESSEMVVEIVEANDDGMAATLASVNGSAATVAAGGEGG